MTSSRNQTRSRIRSRIFSAAIRSGVKCAAHRRVDAVDLGVDHPDLRPWEGEPGLVAVDAELAGGRGSTAFASSRRTRHSRRRRGASCGAELSRVCRRSVIAASELGRGGCKPRSGKRTSTRATPIADRADPVERRQRLAISDPADDGRDGRLGEEGEADDERRDMADRIDQQALADAPGCRARAG